VRLWTPPPPQLTVECLYQSLKLCIKVREPVLAAHFMDPLPSVCTSVYPIVARQLLYKNVTAAMNTHATIGELSVCVV
jgi:hypothetical protein